MFTDAEIRQGANDGKTFQVSVEGGVYRRRPGGPSDDYGCYGHLVPELNTEAGRAAILKILRAERNGKGANRKQTTELVKEFNAGVKKMKTVSKTITIEYRYLSPSDAGKMLRKLHRKQGLSYKYIAEQIGVSPVTVSRWASGENDRELHPNSQIRLWELMEQTTGESGKV